MTPPDVIEQLKELVEQIPSESPSQSAPPEPETPADLLALYPAVVYDLDDTHELLQPILITVREREDAAHASWPELQLFSEAATVSDAIAGLKNEIIVLFDDLSDSAENTLGPLPLRWLRTLRAVVRRTNA